MDTSRHWRGDPRFETHPELFALCERVADAGGSIEFWIGDGGRSRAFAMTARESELLALFNASLPDGVRLVVEGPSR